MHLTFHTEIKDGSCHDSLAEIARYHSSIERKLYAAIAAGKLAQKSRSDVNQPSFKVAFSEKHDLTSRQYNSMLLEVKGKIDGVRECLTDLVETLKSQVKTLKSAIYDLNRMVENKCDAKGRLIGKVKLEVKSHNLHEKKRKLLRLQDKILEAEARIKGPAPGLAFGTKALFHAQFKPGVKHEDWLDQWKSARSSQFILIGTAEEVAGCASCQAKLEDDGSISLKLRPFNAMLKARAGVSGKDVDVMGRRKTITAKAEDFIIISGLRFSHGGSYIRDVLIRNQSVDKTQRVALTWRVVRSVNNEWHVHLSFNVPETVAFDATSGVAGVDFNEDHIAVSIVDKSGNFIDCRRFGLHLYGVKTLQAKDKIRCVARDVVAWAKELNVPIVAEALDFAQKKRSMASMSAKRSRKLSSLHFSDWGKALRSRCLRDGVALKHVNPAYTSLIGRVKFATRLGLSIHHSAAMAIARRGMDLSERLPSSASRIPVGKGVHVTLSPAVSMGHRHVWMSWARQAKAVNAAHVALLSVDKRAPQQWRPLSMTAVGLYQKLSRDGFEPNFHERMDGSIPWRHLGESPGRRPDLPVDGRLAQDIIPF